MEGGAHRVDRRGQAHARRAARDALESATRIAPELAAAWANLAGVLFDLGDVARSVDCLERSLALDDDPDVRENLEVARAAS